MANDLNFGIRITADGSAVVGGVKVAKQSLDELGSSAKQAGDSLDKGLRAPAHAQELSGFATEIRNKLLALISVAAALDLGRRFIEAGDAMTILNSRMAASVTNSQELASVQGQLFDLAGKVEGRYRVLAGAFINLNDVVKSLGGSAQTSANILGTVAAAARLEGQSSEQAAEMTKQLANVLLLGADAGRGLLPVMRENSTLALALADALNLPVESLRKLASEGRLSGEQIGKALADAGPKLIADAEHMTKTVSGSWDAMWDSMTRAAGRQTGINQAIAAGFQSVSEGIEGARISSESFKKGQDELERSGAGVTWIRRMIDGLAEYSLLLNPVLAKQVALVAGPAAKIRAAEGAPGYGPQQPVGAPLFDSSQTITTLNKQLLAVSSVYSITKLAQDQMDALGRSLDELGTKARAGDAGAQQQLSKQTAQVNDAMRSIARNRDLAIAEFNKRGTVSLSVLFGNLDQQLAAAVAGFTRIETVQKESAGRQLAELETFHALGLISEQDYINRQAALQTRAAQAALSTLQETLRAQQAELTAITAQTPRSADDRVLQATKIIKLNEDIANTIGKIGTATSTLDAIEEARSGKSALRIEAERKGWVDTKSAIEDYTRALSTSLGDMQQEFDLIGRTTSEQARARIERQQSLALIERLIPLQRELSELELKGTNPERIAQIKEQMQGYRDATAQAVGQMGDLSDAITQAQEKQQALTDLIRSAGDRGAQFITDFVTKGSSAFKSLWDDFKRWALEAFAKIAAQKIIVSIAGSFGLAGTATNAFAGSNPLGTLLGGGGGFGGIGDIFSKLFGGGPEQLSGPVSELSGMFSGLTESLGSFASFLGPLGIAAGLALPLLAGLFSKGGGPKQAGQAGLDYYTSETSAANNATIQATVDSITNQFTTALKNLGGKGAAAFGLGYDTDPQGKAPSRVSSSVTVDGKTVYSARDRDVGRDDASLQAGLTLEAQRAVLAALKASNLPEDIAHLFDSIDVPTATTEQIAAIEKVAGSYAQINAALLGLPEDIGQHFTDMLDGTQTLADNVLVVVSIIKTFGDSVDGLGPKLEALDAGQITAFVDALGGAQAAAQSFAYLGQNFLTTADRLTQSTKTLNADFAELGLTVPKNHAAFLALLNSFDLTNEAERTMYASVLALSGLFVTVHGTAEAAAGGVNNLADATANLASATDFFNANFYSAAEQQAKKAAAEIKQIADASAALGVSIPTSVEGFRALVEGIDQSTDAGRALYAALIVLAPAVFDLSGAAASAATRVETLVNSIGNINPSLDARSSLQQTIDTFLSQIASVAGQAGGEVGDKLVLQVTAIGKKIADLKTKINYYLGIYDYYNADTLTSEVAAFTQANAQLVRQLAEFTTLKAQYGADIAGQLIDLENWYAEQQTALAGNSQALSILGTVYREKWAAIIAGTKTGVDGTIDQLVRLRQGIADYLKGLQVGELSPLTPREKLNQAKAALDAEFKLAQGGDQKALGDVTRFEDTYLKLARDFFASAQDYTDIYKEETQRLGDLAGTLPTGESPPVVIDKYFPGLSAALPVGSTIVSRADLDAQTKALIDAMSAQAAANDDAAVTVKTAVERGAVWVTDAVSTNRTTR